MQDNSENQQPTNTGQEIPPNSDAASHSPVSVTPGKKLNKTGFYITVVMVVVGLIALFFNQAFIGILFVAIGVFAGAAMNRKKN